MDWYVQNNHLWADQITKCIFMRHNHERDFILIVRTNYVIP